MAFDGFGVVFGQFIILGLCLMAPSLIPAVIGGRLSSSVLVKVSI